MKTQNNLFYQNIKAQAFSKLSCKVCAEGRTASSAGTPAPPPEGRKVWPLPRTSHPPGSPAQDLLCRKLSEPGRQAAPLFK